jgi:hypothetical protein
MPWADGETTGAVQRYLYQFLALRLPGLVGVSLYLVVRICGFVPQRDTIDSVVLEQWEELNAQLLVAETYQKRVICLNYSREDCRERSQIVTEGCVVVDSELHVRLQSCICPFVFLR